MAISLKLEISYELNEVSKEELTISEITEGMKVAAKFGSLSLSLSLSLFKILSSFSNAA